MEGTSHIQTIAVGVGEPTYLGVRSMVVMGEHFPFTDSSRFLVIVMAHEKVTSYLVTRGTLTLVPCLIHLNKRSGENAGLGFLSSKF